MIVISLCLSMLTCWTQDLVSMVAGGWEITVKKTRDLKRSHTPRIRQ